MLTAPTPTSRLRRSCLPGLSSPRRPTAKAAAAEMAAAAGRWSLGLTSRGRWRRCGRLRAPSARRCVGRWAGAWWSMDPASAPLCPPPAPWRGGCPTAKAAAGSRCSSTARRGPARAPLPPASPSTLGWVPARQRVAAVMSGPDRPTSSLHELKDTDVPPAAGGVPAVGVCGGAGCGGATGEGRRSRACI